MNFVADSRSTANGLRRSPNCLATVITKDVEPVLERLDSCLDIVNETLAIVTAAVTKVGSTFGVPDRREGCVNPDWECILKHDVCPFHIRSKVVVLRSDQIQSSTLSEIYGHLTWQFNTIETGW